MCRQTLLIILILFSITSKAEYQSLNSSTQPTCTPCQFSVNSKQKINTNIMLRYRKHYNSWLTESITFYTNQKGNAVYSYNFEYSLFKKNKNDQDNVLLLDVNNDSFKDIAVQISDGASQSLYYYFIFDPKKKKFLPIKTADEKAKLSALPLFEKHQKYLKARMPAAEKSKINTYQLNGNILKLIKTE